MTLRLYLLLSWIVAFGSQFLIFSTLVVHVVVYAQEDADPSSSSSSSSSEILVSQPMYTLQPLNYSISYRQDVCDRQAAFHSGNVTLKDALRGMQLRPFFLRGIQGLSPTDANGNVPLQSREPSIRILDELAQRAGFTWRDSFGSSSLQETLRTDSSGSTTSNATNFDLVVSWAVQAFDLAANEIPKTLNRVATGVSFLEGHLDASVIMVGKSVEEDAAKVNLFSFLAPFDWQVWLLTLFTMIMAGGVYQWMEWINEDSDRQALQNKPTETIYYAALSFNGDIKFQPSTDYARMFVLTLAFWGLILSSAYTANLASFLVIQNTPLLQIESLGEAVAANLPLCVVQGTPQEFETLLAYPQARLVLVLPQDPNQLFINVLNGQCTLAITSLSLWDNAQRNRTLNPGCKLRWIGRTIRFLKSGFATQSDSGTLCTSLIRDVLSVHISEMLDDGTIETIQRQFLSSIQTIDCSRGVDESLVGDDSDNDNNDDLSAAVDSGSDTTAVPSLSLKDLGGLFIVIYCVGAASCIAAMITWCMKRKRQQRETANKTTIEGHDLNLQQENGNIIHGADPERDSNGNANGNNNNNNAFNNYDRDELIFKIQRMRQELEEMHSMVVRKDE